MRAFAILTEPANYTLDLVEKVYRPSGIGYCFLHGNSLAAKGEKLGVGVLDEMPFSERAKYIWSALKSHDAFVVNSYTEKMNYEFILLNLLFFRKPFAIESDTELRIPHNPFKRLIKHALLGWLFSRKCCYGFPGGAHEHVRLFSHYGMPESHIIVMPMVVDNAKYKDVVPKPRNAVFTFGYLGRLVAHKQVDKVVEALPGNSKLKIIGGGEEEARLKALATGKPVEFCGALFGADKIAALHSLDCLVLYSSYEPWGLVIDEALAAGVPVIVSDCVGCRHDLVEGDDPTGLVARWDDEKDLNAMMVKMSSNVEMWRQMSENAVRRMAKWDYAYYGRQLDKYLEVAAHAS